MEISLPTVYLDLIGDAEDRQPRRDFTYHLNSEIAIAKTYIIYRYIDSR